MSVSDSDSSSHGTDYKFFLQTSRDRLLLEMMGSTRTGDSRSTWKVLIMDKVTVKVLSHCCKMSDITDQGISLVEELFKRREPLPSMDVIYFIQPSKENVVMFLSDMSGREPLYKTAYVFFSSSVPKELVNHIKCDSSVLPRIGALREMNLEYFPIDSQAFTTDHDGALQELYGENAENSRKFDACLNVMASRIATVFASLKEFPRVRYRAKTPDASEGTFRDTIPTKLATAVWNLVSKYKSIPNFPQTETCELLILDRSVDQIAPVIHEWTYDAMCHDLLDMEGNKYVVEVPSKMGGEPEKKEVLLEDNDPVWLELRHAHIADASERLHDKMTTLSKNKAAQVHSARDGGEISTRDMQKIVQALPKYKEQIEKLTLHVEIAGEINEIIRDMGLRELGQLEQDLVFGDAGAKEVINFIRMNQLAKLSEKDLEVVKNMQLLAGSSINKKTTSSSFSLKFDNQKIKHAARKDRTGEEETWQLFRFYPVLEELIEKLSKGELAKNEYSCMNEPSSAVQETTTKASARSSNAPVVPEKKTTPHSMRSRRTANWGKSHRSDDGHSGDAVLKNAALDLRKMGQRIFIFIIGGATRSELRACHKLTTKLRREVVLGCTSLDDPSQYLKKLKMLSEIQAPQQDGFRF
ncbi:protein transport Sec1a isoform X3 [Manihot esculenta]|uniref:protein transport Sec1a isoform X3 n=1 Tax=Manihot esculenta TaxID=3983 RepID=UPI001CC7FF78|nr:protein transport Sec1a isoform X3 [Manihot esculenta]